MLPRQAIGLRDDVNVNQLLSDFARDVRSSRPAAPAALSTAPAPRVWTPPPATREPSETEQLRARVTELETRLRALEAAHQIRNDGAGRLNQRVLSVLEQLVAELRER